MNTNLVTDALEYYDNNCEKYKDQFKQVRYIRFENSQSDLNHGIIMMYDKEKKELFRSRYEILGTYYSQTKTWVWAWAVPIFRKNSTNIVRKILHYGTELDPEARFLKTELITSRFRISDPIQLDIHTAIASYLSKKPVIYKWISYHNTMSSMGEYIDTKPHNTEYISNVLFLLDYEKWNNGNNNDNSES